MAASSGKWHKLRADAQRTGTFTAWIGFERFVSMSFQPDGRTSRDEVQLDFKEFLNFFENPGESVWIRVKHQP
jgi:hypothetical protein